MDKGLASLNGKDIHEAYNYIGYPDSVIPLGSEKVYVWGNKDSQLFFTGKSYTEITTECELKIVTNSKDVIINTQWKGDQGGCKPYADGLRRAY